MEARPRADARDQVLSPPACQDGKRFIGISLFWLNLFLLALVVRLPWANIISRDYVLFWESWYAFIVDNGYAALKYDFSNYNPPYLYLLSISAPFFTSYKGYIVIKFISVIFDFVLAFFVYKCVSLKYGKSETVPRIAALVTLLFPTVILNGSAWGQSDSIYSSLLVACLYAQLRGRQFWTFVAFGLSFAFMPQAVFLAPFFLWMLVKKQVSWRYLFLSPLMYIATLLPAWLIGRPLGDLLMIYINQADQGKLLTRNAPNLYQWIPNRYLNLYLIGIVFAAFVVIVIAILVYRSRVEMTENLVVYLATFSVLIMPFILPKMHDRYYFPAEVIAIVLAFYLPKYWFTPVIIGITSLLVYLRYLYGMTLIPLSWLALVPLALIAVLGWQLLRTLGHLPPSRKLPSIADRVRAPRADDRGQVLSISAYHDRKRFTGISLFWLNLFLLALIVRLPWLHFITLDYYYFLEPWYTFIVDNGYFAALKYHFPASDYNPPYLYLLSLGALLFPGFRDYIVIKSISVIFDFVLAFFVYKCVSLKYDKSKAVPRVAALVTLLFPTIILNGSAWGQVDSLYSSLLVACLYAQLSGRQTWAFIAFGLSLAFKPQAVFLAPFLLWMLVKKQVDWRYFFLSPLVYIATLLPAWIIGRPLGDLLMIYINSAGQYRRLTSNAPNLYQWIPNRYFSWYPVGVAFAAIVVIAIAILVYMSRVEMTKSLVVYLATFSVLIMPFILPNMHDRYYFPAEVIAIVFAFYLPKYWFTPMIIGITSLLVYLRYLYGMTLIPLTWLALVPLALIAVLGWQLLRTLGHLPLSRKSPVNAGGVGPG